MEELIGNYTENDLKTKNEFEIYSNIDDSSLEHINLIKDNSKVEIINIRNTEEEYIDDILRILDICNKKNKKITISFEVYNRKILYKFIEQLKKYSTQKIEFKCDMQEYTISEFLEENEKLEQIVKDIKESNMSPLEKYMGVYNIVKKFKPYKENETDLDQSRYIKYVLNNEYMVCLGYSTLLDDLLNRVGIESYIYKNKVSNYDDKANLIESGGHARTIVNIKDDKYNIDGYYIADATWDNHKNVGDTYNYSLRPFESMQKSEDLFSLEEIDYILDNKTFSDFCIKINILLNKKIKQGRELIESYESIFNSIKTLLHELDSKEYKNLQKYIETDEYERTEKFYEEFLTEVGHYIVNKSNKEIKPETLAQAASIAKFYHEDIPEAFKLAYEDKIKREYKDYTYEITNRDIYNQELKEKESKGRHIWE